MPAAKAHELTPAEFDLMKQHTVIGERVWEPALA